MLRKAIYYTKVNLLRLLVPNCDQWLVQSSLIANKLSDKFQIDKSIIDILPFYPPLKGNYQHQRIRNSFIFVSDATPHKNHYRLIQAFCDFFDEGNRGSLTLTIPEKAIELTNLIKDKVKEGYPINNIGFVSRDSLFEQYSKHEYLVFPSLAESFGLGLVEAIECGCKIIASDLPYTYQVCLPSLVFDPLNNKSIQEAFLKTQNSANIPYAQKKIADNIGTLITILEN
ncbi:MAG: glycosyltransferase [Flavobacterium sp.]|nr:MAG: glycosyltransferase [Flavobacterium sp.]